MLKVWVLVWEGSLATITFVSEKTPVMVTQLKFLKKSPQGLGNETRMIRVPALCR